MYNITHLHLFSQRIVFNIIVEEGTKVKVNGIGGLFCQGTKEQCMADIRNFVTTQPLTGKTLVFNIGNNMLGRSAEVGDSVKEYMRNQLNMLKSSIRCELLVRAGLVSHMA